jgi:hypothetical protein
LALRWNDRAASIGLHILVSVEHATVTCRLKLIITYTTGGLAQAEVETRRPNAMAAVTKNTASSAGNGAWTPT